MGLTVGCARCHDHKFDPIPQADYYSLAGIFKSSKTMENFNVVAQWHEYVLAPEAEREEAERAQGQDRGQEQRDQPDPAAENKKLIGESARARIGELSAGGGRRTSLRAHSLQSARLAVGVPRTRAARRGSFDRGNAPRTLEKEKPNVPKAPRVLSSPSTMSRLAAAGDVPVRLAGRRGRRRHVRHHRERRSGAPRQTARGKSRGIAGCGRLERGRRVSAEGGNEYDPAGAQIAVPILRSAAR